jgi:hypothetical protein
MNSPRFLLICVMSLLCATRMIAQAPIAGASFKLDLGAGGGVAFPVSDLGDRTSRGYSVGMNMRMHGFAPVQLGMGVHYNSLPFRPHEFFYSQGSLQHWIINGGMEIPVPMRWGEYPYLSLDFLFSAVENTGSSYATTSSSGFGVGLGMVEPLSRISDIDFTLKYQLLNMFGKDAFDGNFNQIVFAAHIMVGVVR